MRRGDLPDILPRPGDSGDRSIKKFLLRQGLVLLTVVIIVICVRLISSCGATGPAPPIVGPSPQGSLDRSFGYGQ